MGVCACWRTGSMVMTAMPLRAIWCMTQGFCGAACAANDAWRGTKHALLPAMGCCKVRHPAPMHPVFMAELGSHRLRARHMRTRAEHVMLDVGDVDQGALEGGQVRERRVRVVAGPARELEHRVGRPCHQLHDVQESGSVCCSASSDPVSKSAGIAVPNTQAAVHERRPAQVRRPADAPHCR